MTLSETTASISFAAFDIVGVVVARRITLSRWKTVVSLVVGAALARHFSFVRMIDYDHIGVPLPGIESVAWRHYFDQEIFGNVFSPVMEWHCPLIVCNCLPWLALPLASVGWVLQCKRAFGIMRRRAANKCMQRSSSAGR